MALIADPALEPEPELELFGTTTKTGLRTGAVCINVFCFSGCCHLLPCSSGSGIIVVMFFTSSNPSTKRDKNGNLCHHYYYYYYCYHGRYHYH